MYFVGDGDYMTTLLMRKRNNCLVAWLGNLKLKKYFFLKFAMNNKIHYNTKIQIT